MKTTINNLGSLIKIANTLIEKELNLRMNKLFAEYNLTGPQVTLLIYLYEAQERPVSQKEVETVFFLSHPTTRSIVKRLTSKKLIISNPSDKDRRQMILQLSKEGNKFISTNITTIYQNMDQINQKITHNLTESNQGQLIANLQQIINNFQD
ncbi:MAG: MarR family transcriptional regulator [Lactobacillus sp.]|uniref:MarR family winged helix-turn-helix transcriptional regulator n=1 Tax=Bombilactobacillus bombi TaxID=1303590 RepID=UPI0035E8D221|nr:MarR family transcriptional regulator [Lactobacillus sp.]